MTDAPDKIQWHPAFYAAAELELKEDIGELELIQEYPLSKEPIRIDLLVIRVAGAERALKNEIGHMMRSYNVIEYKGPGDEMSIDTFYKTIGYACLYKGYGKNVNEVPAEELTVSLFREAYPRKLFAELKERGHGIEEKYPGIYYVNGNLPFPVQIVVISRLDRQTHSSLRILSSSAKQEDIKIFLEQTGQLKGKRDRSNVDAVLQASVSANYEAYQKVRRKVGMCEALRRLMKDEIEQELKQGIEQGIEQGIAQGLAEGKSEGQAEAIIEMGHEFGLTETDILERLQRKLGISMQKAEEYFHMFAGA